jgi:hypothetical protein
VSDVDLATFSPGPTSGWLGYGYNGEGYLGRTLKPGGDFNGDGIPDALIGGQGQHFGGAIYVVFGTTNFGTSAVDTADPLHPFLLPSGTGITIYSNTYMDFCGEYLDGGADFNGDGFDDVAFGCSGAAPNDLYNAGSVFVVFGHGAPYTDIDVNTMTKGSQGFVINGFGYYAQLARVAFADVNGDGLADVIAGEPLYVNNVYGNVYVLFGKRSNTYQTVNVANFNFDGEVGFKLKGHRSDDRFGMYIASAGDHNGDGYEDFAVQAPHVDYNGRTDTGAIYVIFGHSSASLFDTNIDVNTIPTAALKGFRLYGPAAYQGQITPSFSPGDINGDGLSDLVVNTAYSSDSNRGTTYVLFGHTGSFSNIDLMTYTFTSSKGYRIVGANAWNGAVGNFAGDVNGDGYDDIIVSSGEPKPGRTGSVTAYVLFSHGPGVAYSDISLKSFATGSTTGYRIYSPTTNDGWSMTGRMGDINGDGADDVGFALVAADINGHPRAGISWLLLSASLGPTAGPTARPTARPTISPTARPTPEGWTDIPTVTPTARPTVGPTARPTAKPTVEPTTEPSPEPSAEPTAEPTAVDLKSGRGQLDVVLVRAVLPLCVAFRGS